MFNTKEYALKLDHFYYDPKKSAIVIVIKIRNKRVTRHFTIQEILSDKQALVSLHPIDLCILGMLANSSELISENNKNHLERVIDGFSMAKISPLLEIVSRDSLNEEEMIVLKLKHADKKIRLTIRELYKNKNLINALQYQDALSLGCSLSNFEKLSYEQILEKKNSYKISLCYVNGIYLCLLTLSILISCVALKFSTFNHGVEFRAEIVFLPFIILLQNLIRKIYGFKSANILFITIFISQIIFISYFEVITKLPYPEGNALPVAFNNFYKILLSKSSVFMLSIYAAWLMLYLVCDVLFGIFKKIINDENTAMWLICVVDVVIFFMASLIVSTTMSKPEYSSIDIGYSISILVVAQFFTFSKNWIIKMMG